MTRFAKGDTAIIKVTGKPVEVLFQCGKTVLIRRPDGGQWTYTVKELQPAEDAACSA